VPTSLATHLADVYLDELDKVLGEDMGNAPLAEVLAPHITLLARTPSKAVHDRLTTVLFHPLLAALAESDDDEEGRPTKRRKAAPSTSATGEFDNIVAHAAGATVSKKAARAALLKAMFKAAAADGAVEANRRTIYAVVRAEDEDEDDE
jgi:ribosomal RNA-processing protein 1